MIRDVNHIQLNALIDYIDGQTVTPMTKLHASVSNPNTHEPLQQQRATNEGYLNQALDAAVHAHHVGEWRGTEPDTRAQKLEQIANELEKHLEEMATLEALTTGIVIRQTRALMRLVPLAFRQAAKQVRLASRPLALTSNVEVRRLPWGPAALIVPWSAGAVTAAHKVANALGAGCPVILKPSEYAPHAVGVLAEVIAEAGLPRGVFQLVHGDGEVGLKLVSDPRIKAVSFTGGADVGRTIAGACAPQFKPLQLEMGGVNSLIVLEDADLDAAAEGVVSALITFNGQWWRGLGRLLVHRSRYNALLMRILERLEAVTIGDSLSPNSDMGPLIHIGHLQKVQNVRDHLLACGGVIHEPTRMPELPGYFIAPSLITNCQSSDSIEEVFGPVATVHMFKDDAEAALLANLPGSSITHYIYSADEDRARKLAGELETSGISINGVSLFGLHPQAPHSGWGSSGLGEAGMTETFRFFTGTRTIGVAGS